jgi:hypothetical protein
MSASPKASVSMPFSACAAKSMPARVSSSTDSGAKMSASSEKRKLNCHVGASAASSPRSSQNVTPS